MKRLIFKTIILVAILTTGYYFFILVPEKQKKEAVLKEYANLVQNKIAYVALTRVDSNNPSFETEKANLVSILKETNKKGLNETAVQQKTKEIYQRQDKLLEKVFATKSFDAGLKILKSQEAIDLLVDQTRLIQELVLQTR